MANVRTQNIKIWKQGMDSKTQAVTSSNNNLSREIQDVERAMNVRKLSAKSADPVTDAFKLFDSDGDGYIPAVEIGTPIRALGHVITNSELDGLLKRVRVDKRSQVDLSTFRRMVDSLQHTDYASQLKEAFQVIDKDGIGSVNATELRHLLTTLGDKMSDEEFNVLLQELDIDKTGNITSDDFVYLMTR